MPHRRATDPRFVKLARELRDELTAIGPDELDTDDGLYTLARWLEERVELKDGEN